MDGCVFCGIVNGKIPAYKIAEDDNHVAFLGLFPRYPGMTVIATKSHFGSYVYSSMDDDQLARLYEFTKKVALQIDRGLGSTRCIQVMEGLEVDHAHLKLFPVYKGKMDSLGESAEKAIDEELKKIQKMVKQAA